LKSFPFGFTPSGVGYLNVNRPLGLGGPAGSN